MEEFKDNHLEEDVIHKKEKTLKKVRALSEVNPMLGHRGVRLGITYPEIYSMQIQAILEAAALCAKEGIEVHPEIMVPQVATVEELKRIHGVVQRIHKVVELTHGLNVGYKFGSMLEVVRACLRAGRMAEDAAVLQLRHQRPDAGHLLLQSRGCGEQVPAGLHRDRHPDGQPLRSAGPEGRRRTDEAGRERGSQDQPDLKVGICGEHGGHPGSIHFCHSIGLSYVSCSGPRVPIARLAAAQAKLQETGGKVSKNA
jgi:pyruvate,orthophosphate dikinase